MEGLASLVEEMFPGSRVISVEPMHGGISATISVVELAVSDGQIRKLVARKPSPYRFRENPNAAQSEFETIVELKKAGVLCPSPVALQAPDSFFVLEFIEGRPELAPPDVESFLAQYAKRLAEVHRVAYRGTVLGKLPGEDLVFMPSKGEPNEDLRETEIRNLIAELAPRIDMSDIVLRHGDFWPGNVLWKDGQLVGIIDWEEACLGHPLADIGICRLDIAWILGWSASERFTELYRIENGVDLEDLAYFDLCASLRPIRHLEYWSPAFLPLGRPDVTTEHMIGVHREFVAQAMAANR